MPFTTHDSSEIMTAIKVFTVLLCIAFSAWGELLNEENIRYMQIPSRFYDFFPTHSSIYILLLYPLICFGGRGGLSQLPWDILWKSCLLVMLLTFTNKHSYSHSHQRSISSHPSPICMSPDCGRKTPGENCHGYREKMPTPPIKKAPRPQEIQTWNLLLWGHCAEICVPKQTTVCHNQQCKRGFKIIYSSLRIFVKNWVIRLI